MHYKLIVTDEMERLLYELIEFFVFITRESTFIMRGA